MTMLYKSRDGGRGRRKTGKRDGGGEGNTEPKAERTKLKGGRKNGGLNRWKEDEDEGGPNCQGGQRDYRIMREGARGLIIGNLISGEGSRGWEGNNSKRKREELGAEKTKRDLAYSGSRENAGTAGKRVGGRSERTPGGGTGPGVAGRKEEGEKREEMYVSR